jgi:hypothetical protein
MSDTITKAVLQAFELAPCSQRALAIAAGVPHSTLVRIRAGEFGASEKVARGVAEALRRWASDCQVAADAIERATGHTTTARPRGRRNQEG